MLILSGAASLPIAAGAKRGLKNLEHREPLEVRLPKVDLGTINEESNLKEGSMSIENTKKLVNKVGYHKVACALLKKEGTDYGNPDTLDLKDVAKILGTKLAMIHMEHRNIVNGLNQLRDLTMEKDAFFGMTSSMKDVGKLTLPFLAGGALVGAATGVGKSFGEGIGNSLHNMVDKIMNKNKRVIFDEPQRKMIIHQLMTEDNLIGRMPEEKVLEAYKSMVDVAPTLSTDKNAVKSFLRAVSMAPEGGVDWNTLKGLADAEKSVLQAKELHLKI